MLRMLASLGPAGLRLSFSVMWRKAICVSAIAMISGVAIPAEPSESHSCSCRSPQELIDFYIRALQLADTEAVLSVYPVAENFSIPALVRIRSYEIISAQNVPESVAADWAGEPQLWMLPDTIQLIVEQSEEAAKPRRYFYYAREINGQWVLVGHSAEDAPE